MGSGAVVTGSGTVVMGPGVQEAVVALVTHNTMQQSH